MPTFVLEKNKIRYLDEHAGVDPGKLIERTLCLMRDVKLHAGFDAGLWRYSRALKCDVQAKVGHISLAHIAHA